MSTEGIHMAVAELLSFSRAVPKRRLISSCRRGITPHGSCRITALMAPLLLNKRFMVKHPAEAWPNRVPRNLGLGVYIFKGAARLFFKTDYPWRCTSVPLFI